MITDLLVAVLLLATAATGTAVALTREPTRQALVLSAYGLVLGGLMVALQAPDVALAQIGIGTAIVPLLVVLTVAKVDRELERPRRRTGRGLVSRRLASRLLATVGLIGAGTLLLVALGGLPRLGDVPHPYADRTVPAALSRNTANVISSVNFDQRAFDTLGEEFVLFSAAVAALLLLRRFHDEDARRR